MPTLSTAKDIRRCAPSARCAPRSAAASEPPGDINRMVRQRVQMEQLWRAEAPSLVALIPLPKLFVRLSQGRLRKAPHTSGSFLLGIQLGFRIFSPTNSHFSSFEVQLCPMETYLMLSLCCRLGTRAVVPTWVSIERWPRGSLGHIDLWRRWTRLGQDIYLAHLSHLNKGNRWVDVGCPGESPISHEPNHQGG